MKIFLKIKSKRMLFWLFIFFVLSLSSYIYLTYQLQKSKPHIIAKNFLAANATVNYHLGAPVKFSINPFIKNLVKYNNDGTAIANFSIKINGTKEDGMATMDLRDDGTGWHIISADLQVNNNKIDLIEKNKF